MLLLHGAPQSHVSWRLVAPKLAADTNRGRSRSARIRRQQQAAGRREPRQLLQARHGARPGRGDEAFRLRQVSRHRSRSRRTRDASHGARSRRQGDARRRARHRARRTTCTRISRSSSSSATSTGSTICVRRRDPRTISRRRPRHRRHARRTRFSSSTCARRATRRTSTPCARTIAPAPRSISRTTKQT